MKQNILAIETSGSACSAALITQNQCFTRFELTQKAHTQLILPMVHALLEEAQISLQDITAIAVGRGPGSFTGVRIAMSAAQGLAFGLNVPVFPVSTLAALSYQAQVQNKLDNAVIVPALDARMHELYAAAFLSNDDRGHLFLPDCLINPAQLLESLTMDVKSLVAIGSGWDNYFDEITSNAKGISIYHMPNCHVNALHIGLIAKAQIEQGEKGVMAKDAIPVYLRDNVAEKQR